MSDSPDPPLICDNVSRVYRQSGGRIGGHRAAVSALSGVSLSVGRGDIIGIAGPSGSGKSTLLHLLAGLDTPTEGAVRLVGQATNELSGRTRTRLRLKHIGLVFQRFYLLPSLSARANVALPLVERGVRRRTRRTRAEQLLEQVGLGDRSDHKPTALSGGEQQRVAVARALVTDPDVIVADEPTGELDTETGETVLDTLTQRNDETAIVLASHDDRALARTDRIIRLRDGRRVTDTDTDAGTGTDTGSSSDNQRQRPPPRTNE